MDNVTQTALENLRSGDRGLQNHAFQHLIEATSQPVEWAYEIWDEMLKGLNHQDNHQRAIAAQVLCNLAKSDPKQRMRKDFGALLEVTKDPKFVTARHCLLSLWKVGAAGPAQRKIYVDGVSRRYRECISERNGTLIRYDIMQGFRKLYDVSKNEDIKQKALQLIETEEDLKYRKKYASVWRK